MHMYIKYLYINIHINIYICTSTHTHTHTHIHIHTHTHTYIYSLYIYRYIPIPESKFGHFPFHRFEFTVLKSRQKGTLSIRVINRAEKTNKKIHDKDGEPIPVVVQTRIQRSDQKQAKN